MSSLLYPWCKSWFTVFSTLGYICICVYILRYICMCVYVCIYVYMSYIHINVYVYVNVHTHGYVSMYIIYMHVCVYAIHIWTLSFCIFSLFICTVYILHLCGTLPSVLLLFVLHATRNKNYLILIPRLTGIWPFYMSQPNIGLVKVMNYVFHNIIHALFLQNAFIPV